MNDIDGFALTMGLLLLIPIVIVIGGVAGLVGGALLGFLFATGL
jgi:hypothetical protein